MIAIDLSIDTALARKILTGFIKTEITRAGFSRAVLGLSGGIDSAVSCVLAAEALGAHNVLAVRMPYQTSNPDSLEHAQQVIQAAGVQSRTIPITNILAPYFDEIEDISDLRRGNLMSRLRMAVLFDQSAAFDGLVLGTGNKTELLLGYSTQFGDSACAINPLGDLYKTQLRQLAAAIGVPQAILDKAPSADLWPGQTDEGELGFTYAEVDRLLYLLVDKRFTPRQAVEQGFSERFVSQVLERMRRSQYKRVMPPIAKLSDRTVGWDFLYPRDWGI